MMFRYRQNRSLGGWRAVFGLGSRASSKTGGGRA